MGFRSNRIMWLGSALLVFGLLLVAMKVIVIVATVILSLAVPLAIIGVVLFLLAGLWRRHATNWRIT